MHHFSGLSYQVISTLWKLAEKYSMEEASESKTMNVIKPDFHKDSYQLVAPPSTLARNLVNYPLYILILATFNQSLNPVNSVYKRCI